MYWGNPDVSVKFCEDKYKVSNYVAEYYNTLSAISYIIVGIFLCKTNLKEIAISTILLGIGTGILHCTLRYYGQWLDEISMLTLSFFLIKRLRKCELNKETNPLILFILFFTYFVFTNYFIVFLSIFSALQVYIYKLSKSAKIFKNRWKRRLINLYIFIFIISSICWVMDQTLCKFVKSYNLHAIWHIGTSLSLLLGSISLLD